MDVSETKSDGLLREYKIVITACEIEEGASGQARAGVMVPEAQSNESMKLKERNHF